MSACWAVAKGHIRERTRLIKGVSRQGRKWSSITAEEESGDGRERTRPALVLLVQLWAAPHPILPHCFFLLSRPVASVHFAQA